MFWMDGTDGWIVDGWSAQSSPHRALSIFSSLMTGDRWSEWRRRGIQRITHDHTWMATLEGKVYGKCITAF